MQDLKRWFDVSFFLKPVMFKMCVCVYKQIYKILTDILVITYDQ